MFLATCRTALVAALLPLAAGTALGQAMLIEGPDAFSGFETLIDFDGLTNGTQISTQYIGDGAFFELSGGGSPWSSGNALTNVPPGWGPGDPALEDLTVTFIGKMNRVGFEIRNNEQDDLLLTIQRRSNGQVLGTHFFQTSFNAVFVGIESAETFDQITVDVTAIANGAFFFDDLRFENDPNANVVDTFAPAVTITSPAGGTIFKTFDAVVEASVSDASPTTVVSTPAGISGSLIGGGGTLSGLVALDEGENVIAVNATDASGNVGGGSVTVIRDTIAPTVTVLSPPSGSVVANSSVIASLLVEDATGITVFFAGETFFLPPGRHMVTGTVDLVEGVNFTNWEAIDQANNSSGVGTLELTLDFTAPVVRIDSPTDGELFGAGEELVAVTATVDDMTATDVSSLPVGVVATLPALGGIVAGVVTLQEGANAIVISATDEAGLTGTDSIVLILDTTAPVVAIDSPPDGSAVSGVIDFAGRAADLNGAYGSGVEYVELMLDGVVLETQTDPLFTFLTLLDTTALSDGTHELSIRAVDREGNEAVSALSVVTVDNTPPSIQIIQPLPGELVGGALMWNAVVDDGESGVDDVTMLVAGEAPNVTNGSGSFGGVPSVSVDSTADTTTQPDGTLALTVAAADLAGNEAVATVLVEVDNTQPTSALVAPADGDIVSGTILLVAEASGPDLVQLLLRVDGVEVGSTTGSTLSVPFDTESYLDGVICVEAIALDQAGNASTQAATVEIDNLSVRLTPRTLSLKSKGIAPVRARVAGASVGLLMPTEDHAIQLLVPGGAPVPATVDWNGDETLNGDGELSIDFDRQALIASVRAGIAAGQIESGGRARVTLVASGRSIGSVGLKIVGK